MKTFEKLTRADGHPGIYALDCEMVGWLCIQNNVKDFIFHQEYIFKFCAPTIQYICMETTLISLCTLNKELE